MRTCWIQPQTTRYKDWVIMVKEANPKGFFAGCYAIYLREPSGYERPFYECKLWLSDNKQKLINFAKNLELTEDENEV